MAAKPKKAKSGEEFFFCNGTVASTVAKCRVELEKLTADQFSHHVNEYKNDIYIWLRDCVDKNLAERIKDIRDQQTMLKTLGS